MPGTIDFADFAYEDVCYGTVANANEYFSHKPQALDDWSGQTPEQQQKALYEATVAIDKLRYAGQKTSVFNLYVAQPSPAAPPSQADIDTADATQPLQFPRDGATEVPDDIIAATYEEAQSILCGRNAGIAQENLAITSDGAGSTRTSYNRDNAPSRHIVNGITSYFAWRFIQPFLADISGFNVVRV